MQTPNTDLGGQLEASAAGSADVAAGAGESLDQAPALHQEELYVLLEGEGRVRVGEEVLTLAPLDTLLVEPAPIASCSTTPTPTSSGWSSARRRRR